MDFIIDGNAYLNVAVSIIKNIIRRDKTIGSDYYVNDIFNDGKFILKEEAKIQFRNFCLTYLYSLLAPIGNRIDSVHFVFDSRSWRKDFTSKFFEKVKFSSDSAPEEFAYKGKRKYDDKIYLFFNYFQKELLPAITDKTNINCYRIPETEGDDIISYLCEIIKNDIMIYTVDGDIRQLTYSSGKNVIVIYPKQMSKHKKLCVPQELNPDFAQDEIDDFFSLNESHIIKSTMTRTLNILKQKDYVEYQVDPVLEIFTKIFRGDKKDNIPKMDKMTPTKTDKMINLIKEEYGNNSINLLDMLDESFINFVIKNLSILNKITDINKLKDIRKHFLFNTRLIRLSSKLFPPKVVKNLKENISASEFKKFGFKNYTKLKNNPTSI